MPNLNWSKLTGLQLGRYAEYYAKMEFASYGFEVYTSEVDDHGVDFIAKKSSLIQGCSLCWREYVGIEPTQDATNAQRLVLKTRGHTSTHLPP